MQNLKRLFKHTCMPVAFRSDNGKIAYRCKRCKKRMYRLPRPTGINDGERPEPYNCVYNIQLDIAKAALIKSEGMGHKVKLKPDPKKDFIKAVAARLLEKVFDIGEIEALAIAADILKSMLDLDGIEFGDPTYDWSEDAAETLADEFVSEFCEPLSN